MSPAGRPPLRGKSSMGYTLRIRLTEAERFALERLAAKAGVSVSEYVRGKALGGKPLKQRQAFTDTDCGGDEAGRRKVSLTIGSLFSGIGGLELGLERAGLGPVKWQVEIDALARDVLHKHWPNVRRYDDVRTVCVQRGMLARRGGDGLEAVDIICGGFPCQNLSHANVRTRNGLAGEKSGLWSDFRRIASAVGPRWAVVENVADAWREWVPVVRRDLGQLGYASVPIRVSASDVGAPFGGARVFVVAQAYGNSESTRAVDAQMAELPELADARRQEWGQPSPRALGMADGVSRRMDRLRMTGNAVVPAMAEAIGNLIRLAQV